MSMHIYIQRVIRKRRRVASKLQVHENPTKAIKSRGMKNLESQVLVHVPISIDAWMDRWMGQVWGRGETPLSPFSNLYSERQFYWALLPLTRRPPRILQSKSAEVSRLVTSTLLLQTLFHIIQSFVNVFTSVFISAGVCGCCRIFYNLDL